MKTDPDGNDAARKDAFLWKRVEGQSLWIKVGLAFLGFYVGEAVLFWQGVALAGPLLRVPLAVPLVYPLGYWGLFGFVIYRLLRKHPASQESSAAERRFVRWQKGLLTLVITIGAIGSAFLIMKASGSTTLGHVVLFLVLYQSAAVIGAMDLNVGWLAAAGLWLLTALAIARCPVTWHLVPHFKNEDLLVGLAISLGFILIGVLPHCVDREGPVARDDRDQGD